MYFKALRESVYLKIEGQHVIEDCEEACGWTVRERALEDCDRMLSVAQDC